MKSLRLTRKSLRLIRISFQVFLSFLLLVGMSSMADASAHKKAVPLTTIRMGLAVPVAENPDYYPLVLAQRRGYFAKNHVSVDLTAYSGGPPAQTALASGQEDIIDFTPSGVLAAISKGVAEKLIAIDAEAAGQLYVILPVHSKIKTVRQLNGASIGVTSAGSLTYAMAVAIAKKFHITLNEIPLGSPGYVISVETGSVQAGLGPLPSFYKALDTKKVKVLSSVTLMVRNFATDVDAASTSFIQSHPAAIRGFLAGWWEAVNWMQNHRLAAIRDIASNESVPFGVAAKLWSSSIKTIPIDGAMKASALNTALAIEGVDVSKLPRLSTFENSRFLP